MGELVGCGRTPGQFLGKGTLDGTQRSQDRGSTGGWRGRPWRALWTRHAGRFIDTRGARLGFGAAIQPQVLDQLSDARNDAGLTREAPEKGVATRACRRVERTRHEKALPTLFEGPPGGDQRPALATGFYDDRGVRQAADEPVAPWERPPGRARFRRKLGHDRSAGRDDRLREAFMGLRKESGVSAAEHSHGRATFGDDGRMGGPVDADRQSRDDRGPGPGNCRADPARDQTTLVSWASGADHGHGVSGLQCRDGAADEQQRWRQLDTSQPIRIGRFLQRNHGQTEGPNLFHGSGAAGCRLAYAGYQIAAEDRPATRSACIQSTRPGSAAVVSSGANVEDGSTLALMKAA